MFCIYCVVINIMIRCVCMCVHDIEMSSVIYSWCSLGIIIAGNFQSVKFSCFSQLTIYILYLSFFFYLYFSMNACGLYI